MSSLSVMPVRAGIAGGTRDASPAGALGLAGVAKWLAGLALALLALIASPAQALTFPNFTGLVVDQANVLPADRKAALEQKLEALQQKNGRQLVVATVSSLEGTDIQDYGYQLGRAWDVGLKGAGNGTILLIAPNERKVGISTASGISGLLTDAYTSVVINSKILPAFKAGDLPGGIEAGTDALIDILSQPDDQAQAKEQAAVAAWNKAHQRSSSHGGSPGALIFWLFVIAWIVIAGFFRRARQGRRYGGSDWPIWLWAAESLINSRSSGGGWGDSGGSDGGSSGGGWMDGGFTGGGGGGGSFDGGGSSGSW